MFLIPLNQIESVDLVIHALRTAAGDADCTTCPVRKVCMQQCRTLAEGIQRLVESNSLPRMDGAASDPEPPPAKPPTGRGPGLRVVK
ncbi:MAG: hypothetical protein RQ723_11535 [Desulfuromonadales bacterium]|nr:hypothetical protein [Desulfuromonadales bacterium]